MKLKRLISALLVLCSLLLCLVGCKTDKASTSDETTGETTVQADDTAPVEGDSLVLTSNSQTKYVLVHPNRPSDEIKVAMNTISNAFSIYYGVELTVESETMHATDPAEYEILLGETNRPESQQTMQSMKYNDWVIEAVGKKLVIAAGTELGLQKAAISFATQTMEVGTARDPLKTVSLAPNYLLEQRDNYPLEKITIDGVDISEFVLVNSRTAFDANIALMTNIQNVIGMACGVTLRMVNDRAVQNEHEILVGETTRAATASYYSKKPDAMEYSFRIADGHFQILMPSIYTASKVLAHFTQAIGQAEGSLDLNVMTSISYTEEIDPALTARYEGTTLRLMTNNILTTNTEPGEERVKLLAKLYRAYMPDFLCLQEVDTWHSILPDWMPEEYALLNAIPEGKSSVTNNGDPIYYRKDRFDVLECRCFTTTPFERDDELTYGVFRDKTNGKIYIVFSLHWVVNGTKKLEDSSPAATDVYRQASAKVILETVAQLKEKYSTEYVFVLGDFNAIESTQSYKDITAGLDDAKYIAEVRANLTSNTGHTFGQMPLKAADKPRNYDYILVNGDSTRVMTHDIILSDYAINSSDHCPVYVDVILK